MKDKLREKWDEAERTGEPVLVGDIVVCDICDADFTESDASGGFIFGSYAYCPGCAETRLPEIRSYGEEHYIRARCPDGVAFADFVREYRGPASAIHIRRGG